MKKWMALCAVVLLLCGGMLFRHTAALKGDTVESREAILRNRPKNIPWNIAVEQAMEGHLLCGITAGQKTGIAVFTPERDGYGLLSSRWLDRPDSIVIDHAVMGGKMYDLIWFNGAQTEYAELTYTEPGKRPETLRCDTAGMPVICCEAPAGDYTLQVRYFDAQGNVYE